MAISPTSKCLILREILIWRIYNIPTNIHEFSAHQDNWEILPHEKGVYELTKDMERVLYEGTYFNTLSTNFQVQINQFLKNNILFEDTINVIYFLSLNREVFKYIHYLKTIMEGFVSNYDPKINNLHLSI